MSIKLPEELIFLQNRNVKQKQCHEVMENKVCLISGATSGVGLEALKVLAAKHAKLVIIARNEKKALKYQAEIKRQYQVDVDILLADFADLQSVRALASQILAKYPKIDVFINSIGVYATKLNYTVDNYEEVFQVNHLAPFLLLNLLIDRFKKSDTRIILVNSEGHRFNGLNCHDLNWEKRPYMGLRSYGASKTAQLLTMGKFKELFNGSKVTINAMHPGEVKTNIGNNNGLLYRWFLHHITWHFLKEPEIAGLAIYYLAASKEMQYVSNRFFNLTIDEKVAKHARNSQKADKIWDLSCKMVNL